MEAPTWLRHTLDEIIGQIRRLLDVSGCAFQVVDFEAGTIRPAAAWFASDEARDAMTPVLERSYDRERPGVTEAAIERGESLLIADFEAWEGATGVHTRLQEELAPEDARVAWDWYRSSSFISCPVRTAGGRTLGVLAISSRAPQPLLGAEELRLVEVFADLAALALERSELLDREERRRPRGAASSTTRPWRSARRSSSTPCTRRSSSRRRGSSGATKVALRRYEPATGRPAHGRGIGFTDEGQRTRFRVGEGMIGEVARTGRSYVSDPADERPLRALVHRARGHRLVRARPHRARPTPVRRAHRQPHAARLLRRGGARAAGGVRASRPPAPSPTRSTSTASAGSPPPSRAGSSRTAPATSPASSSASSTSRPATTWAAATSSACGRCRAARWRCSWAT